ncbi:dipeptidase PepV [Clostridiaceae bacterium 35-E11]
MQEIDKKVQELEKEIIYQIQQVIKIKSIEETPQKNMPFGEGVDRCLRYVLELAKKLGFQVKYEDGYYGYVEMGAGKEIVGILGHLDVVPEGDPSAWTYPPYEGAIDAGKIFGRGAIDDKGPTIGALYAMKIIKDLGYPMNKRIRLILGTNEETSWKGINRYKEREEIPICGFTPDSDYPLIYAEKGLLQFQLTSNRGTDISLFGGNAYNSVPDQCQYNNEDTKLIEALEDMGFKYVTGKGFIKVVGKAAHSAKAWNGINAIVRLCMVLHKTGVRGEAIDFIAEMIEEDYYAQKVVGNCEDVPSGKLTFNVATINLSQEGQSIGVDVRFPVTKNKDEIVTRIKAAAEKYGLTYKEIDYLAPLYVSTEDELVKKLRKIFEEETGLDSMPIATGGATYARAFKNFVAFGPLFPGKEKMAHQKDEYIEIKPLMQSIKMYAKVIQELGK